MQRAESTLYTMLETLDGALTEAVKAHDYTVVAQLVATAIPLADKLNPLDDMQDRLDKANEIINILNQKIEYLEGMQMVRQGKGRSPDGKINDPLHQR